MEIRRDPWIRQTRPQRPLIGQILSQEPSWSYPIYSSGKWNKVNCKKEKEGAITISALSAVELHWWPAGGSSNICFARPDEIWRGLKRTLLSAIYWNREGSRRGKKLHRANRQQNPRFSFFFFFLLVWNKLNINELLSLENLTGTEVYKVYNVTEGSSWKE